MYCITFTCLICFLYWYRMIPEIDSLFTLYIIPVHVYKYIGHSHICFFFTFVCVGVINCGQVSSYSLMYIV